VEAILFSQASTALGRSFPRLSMAFLVCRASDARSGRSQPRFLILVLFLGFASEAWLAGAGRVEDDAVVMNKASGRVSHHASKRSVQPHLETVELRATRMLRVKPAALVELVVRPGDTPPKDTAEVAKKLEDAQPKPEDQVAVQSGEPQLKPNVELAVQPGNPQPKPTPQESLKALQDKDMTGHTTKQHIDSLAAAAQHLEQLTGSIGITQTLGKADEVDKTSQSLAQGMMRYAKNLERVPHMSKSVMNNLYKYHANLHNDISSSLKDATLPSMSKELEHYYSQKGGASRIRPVVGDNIREDSGLPPLPERPELN